MKIAVINCSSDVYNFATAKMVNKFRTEGHEVFVSSHADMWASRCERAYLSAIFTYDLPELVIDAKNLQMAGVEVEIGGPGPTALPQYVMEKTGITPHVGLDERFEHIPGDNYELVFTSRGCVRKCPWCLAWRIEPDHKEYDEFPIPTGKTPKISDNCILATTERHQRLVVEKLKDIRRLDINSGFDCRFFTEEHYQLYSQLHLDCWRLAFDSMGVEKDFARAVGILKNHGVDYRRIIVYVLINFPGTTFEESVYRLEKTRDLGCSPYPQRFMPLNSVDARNFIAPGYDKEELERLRLYWLNPFAWRTCTFDEFKRKFKPGMDNNPSFVL